VLFVGNNVLARDVFRQRLRAMTVLAGVSSSGGAFEGDGELVYVEVSASPLVFGNLLAPSGDDEGNCAMVTEVLGDAQVKTSVVPDIQAWLLTHAALIPPLGGALYSAGSSIKRLADSPRAISLLVQSLRECLGAITRSGMTIRPAALGLAAAWLPAFVLRLAFARFFRTEMAVFGGERGLNSGPDETKFLADHFRDLFAKTSGTVPPASAELFNHIDAKVESWSKQ
jgi:2-dehydropantoate 2-reductase